ncbi:MAG: glycosyltransferase family 9 protein [Patescibacteria group bacterium]|nr:glycosyltransferase family 9 protein [Patescibacteria group bacterium]
MNNKQNKILLLRSDGIGDFILSIPALKFLRQKNSKAQIWLFTGKWQREIAQASNLIDRVICWEDSQFFFKKADRLKFLSYRMLNFIPLLRKQHFDLGIDFQENDPRNRLIMGLIGIRQRRGFGGIGFDFLLNDKIVFRKKFHRFERCLDLVKASERDRKKLDFTFNLPLKNQKKVNKFLKDNSMIDEDQLIIMHPISRFKAKAWPKEKFVCLADKLSAHHGCKIILVGVKSDKCQLKKISHLMRKKPLIAAGKLNLVDLACLMKKATVFIGNDSAPMHLSAAFSLPTIGLFGPTFFAPVGRQAIAIRKIEYSCSDCLSKVCKYPKRFCLNKITVSEVYSLVKQFID